uniref:HMG box domain-containing protein n=1 Tax=Lates calcarifer TaxID=8187 RepID=A0A4W6FGF9_LATCA
MAKADKVRYNREMRDYVPPRASERGAARGKTPTPPKDPRLRSFVFCSEYRPSVKQQYPGLSIGDCAKRLGEMWSKLSQSEKQPYEEKAQKLREKYDRVRHGGGRGDRCVQSARCRTVCQTCVDRSSRSGRFLSLFDEVGLTLCSVSCLTGHGGVPRRRHVRQEPRLFSSGRRGGGGRGGERTKTTRRTTTSRDDWMRERECVC